MYELFLVEQGVEIDVEADTDEVVRILDREVSNFGTDTRRFKLEVGKATLGREWQMVVRPLDTLSGRPMNDSLGFVTVTKVDDNTIQVRIPPKAEWEPSPLLTPGDTFQVDFSGLETAIYRYYSFLGNNRIPGSIDTRPQQ